MKADLILKNAKIYTVNDAQPWAEAAVIKDGKFIYVGDAAGAAGYDGETIDAGGKFVMPALIDSHAHLGMSVTVTKGQENLQILEIKSYDDALIQIKEYVEAHPEEKKYTFLFAKDGLGGRKLTRFALDEISDKPIFIREYGFHSVWVNTAMMKKMGIDEFEEDMAPGLSYYDRDEDGRVDGEMYEFCGVPRRMRPQDPALFEKYSRMMVDYWKDNGVAAVFDAGMEGEDDYTAPFFQTLVDMDKAGDLPIYMQCCYYFTDPARLDYAIEKLKGLHEKYRSDHVKVDIMKAMYDGITTTHTACVLEPYDESGAKGGTLLSTDQLSGFLEDLNEAGFDFHAHAVGDGTNRVILDAVEDVKNRIGDDFRIQVTAAHCELVSDADIPRYNELGVILNMTPIWHGGGCDYNGEIEIAKKAIGKEKASRLFRVKSIWDTGATIAFSSDTVLFYGEMNDWNPYVGIEVGMTRQNRDMYEDFDDLSSDPVFPDPKEVLSLEQMIKGYTINGAKQMRLDDRLGSIEEGKDGSFLIFDKNLFETDKYQIHHQRPIAVYFAGRKMK